MNSGKYKNLLGSVVELMVSDRSATVFDLCVVISTIANRKSIKQKTIEELYFIMQTKKYLTNPKDAQELIL